MLTAGLVTLAMVAHDQAPLKAHPKDSAAHHAVLWQGEALEIRGRKLEYVQVWDHRRERGGYVHASQVREVSLAQKDIGEMRTVIRFLRDTPGAESLGIGYSAAYIQAAPREALVDGEVFDHLGHFAQRLARRASMKHPKATADAIAAHMEAVAAYGVRFRAVEQDGTATLCYDGDAFTRVLAVSADAAARARAALGLTQHPCVDPTLRPDQRLALDHQRLQVLDQLTETQFALLNEQLKNRVRMRRASVAASIAFHQAWRGEVAKAGPVAQVSLAAFAGVNKTELSDDDWVEFNETAVRVGASRWAAVPATTSVTPHLRIATESGEPGQTCVTLVDEKTKTTLTKRCTYGVVWTASANVNRTGDAVALAVQTLPAWRELWMFRKDGNAWTIDIVPPSANGPDLGVIEFAGWVPGTRNVLIAREARERNGVQKRFESATLPTLTPEKWAGDPQRLLAFSKWQDPQWKAHTVMLR